MANGVARCSWNSLDPATILGLRISYRGDTQAERVVPDAGYFFTRLRWKATG